jgi:exodeoxyribonuclease V alpha subunit
VLSPTKRNACGTAQLNSHLQQLLNPPAPNKQELPAHHSSSSSRHQQHHSHKPVGRVGDRVVHLVNDTERDVYNGDLGVVQSVDVAEGSLTVRYPPRSGSEGVAHLVKYQGNEIGEQLQLAWAITVHKVRSRACHNMRIDAGQQGCTVARAAYCCSGVISKRHVCSSVALKCRGGSPFV